MSIVNPKNMATIEGHLTADPIFVSNKENKEFQAKFSLAVRRNYRNKEGEYGVDFIPCHITGENRMDFAHRLCKGTAIRAVGAIKSDEYVNKEGKKVYPLYFETAVVDYPLSNNRENNIHQVAPYTKAVDQVPQEPVAGNQKNTTFYTKKTMSQPQAPFVPFDTSSLPFA